MQRPSNVSAKGERYRGFFQELMDTLREEHNFMDARKAQPKHWHFFPTGHAQRARYRADFAQGNRARINLYINSIHGDRNKELFDQLQERQADIQSELGETLEWERLDDRRASRIAVVRRGSIDDDEETLAEIRAWMVERLLKFKQVFGPRLDELVV